jgi:hypothetical protein
MPANIRPGWNCIEELNTLAYYHTATIGAEKGFYNTAPGECNIKLFVAVIAGILYYAKVFATAIDFHASLILAGKVGAYFIGLHYT